eukprot:CAMPEP_0181451372 /NCGR_PEP_ID=MMETSP1110-20121109/28658_1 /TAXON_ID=174948 /ORGANISM="Symbiodinium sp., Strain CCMP421" /LENGTH=55 /DNA_ID=CAMNT_0023575623 /DNA_START=161 /DNA_END=328 /DNA_ORIENTATION=-
MFAMHSQTILTFFVSGSSSSLKRRTGNRGLGHECVNPSSSQQGWVRHMHSFLLAS